MDVSEFVTTDGVTIGYSCRGIGRHLFVCHGGPLGTFKQLARDVRALEDEFTLVFHDYRGSGASSAAATESYDFAHLADDFDQLRTHLGDEQIDVLGHSMGVSVALHFALRHPSSLRRLVLVGGSPISAKLIPWSMMRALGPSRLATLLLRGLTFIVRWSWRPGSSGRNEALLALSRTTGESRREYRHTSPGVPLADNDNTRRLQHEFLNLDVSGRLDEIDRPTLVLYGGRDAVATAGASRFVQLKNVEFRVLVGVGHEVFADAAELAVPAMRAFLLNP